MAARDDGALINRRALEALRNGVPNREAVRMLGCRQPKAEAKFAELLKSGSGESTSPGMLVSGDFGSGKSHLLAHLEREALARGFVCSKVIISKETPLYDLGRVFRSAVESARMPDRQGRLIEELGLAAELVAGRSSEKSLRFRRWADDAASNGVVSPIFPATLLVYEGAGDLELNGKIEAFWAGDRIRVSDVKDGLRRIGQKQAYVFRAPKAADLAPQRLRFVTELIRVAGYRGWVVLVDELELIGSYSLLQRGRSYAQLARWLGRDVNCAVPGLLAVGTVTDDFASAIISPDGKKDRDYVEPRLADSRHADLRRPAQTGMRLLEQSCIGLNAPTEDDVDATLDRLRRIYSDAYGWEAPRLKAKTGGVGIQARMRYKVRASINEWDLLRIYPDSIPDTVGGEFHHAYQENTDLERESRDDASDVG